MYRYFKISDELLSSIKLIVHPYYLFNILLSLSFIGIKSIDSVCTLLIGSHSCEMSMWESEIMFFLIVIVMFRTRKSGSRTFLAYISTFSMYAKTCNVLLWFSLDPIKGIIYIILVLVHFLLTGEPVYKGPENVVYFDSLGPTEELKKDRNTYWLIVFYASWNTTCGKLAPIFSKLSLEYGLSNLKFGKVDIGRYPELAKTHHINNTSFSLQLPTISLFKGEKELMRRPCLDQNGKFLKFYFTEDNIRAAYDLNNLLRECKKKKGVPTQNKNKKDD